MQIRKTIIGTITRMAVLASLAVAFTLPAGYFLMAYQFERGSLNSEAEVNGLIVTGLINANPDLWRFEEMRLEELLSARPATGEPESRRIVDQQGQVVAASASRLVPPVLTVSREVLDSGHAVGRLEISRSLQPLLMRTAIFVVLGIIAGLLLYFLFRILPIRAVIEAEGALRESGEFLARIMESTTNAILVIAADGRIAHANQRCSELTGYPLAELIGQPFARLFPESELASILETLAGIRQSGVAVLGMESRILGQDGRLVPVSWGGAPLSGGADQSGTVFTAEDISRSKLAQEEKERLILELRNTLSELQTLRGIIPICSYCKKIRDDAGVWSQLEAYIHEHSGAQFSHGICPECYEKQMAELNRGEE